MDIARFKYANYAVLKPYLTDNQKRIIRAKVADRDGDKFPVSFHMLHNDEAIRTTFVLNIAAAHLVVDLPIDFFNALPWFEPKAVA